MTRQLRELRHALEQYEEAILEWRRDRRRSVRPGADPSVQFDLWASEDDAADAAKVVAAALLRYLRSEGVR